MADVFLSYAKANARSAGRVAQALRGSGLSVWYDPEIPAHRAYADVIAGELEAAKAVLVLWSTAAVESQWVRSEANRAREVGKLVQARLDDARLPMPFDQIQCADLEKWRHGRAHAGWSQVTSGIDALVRAEAPPTSAPEHSPMPSPMSPPGRREVLAGGAAIGAIAAGGAGWWMMRGGDAGPSISPATAALMQQAKGALWQNTPEGQNQAIGISRQVASSNPALAEAWGRLAMAYALTSHWRNSAESQLLQQRARSAAQQGLSIDRRNAHAIVGRAWAKPFMGHWLAVIPEVRRAVAAAPKDGETNFMLAMNLAMIGRSKEALEHANPILDAGPTPGIYVWHSQMLWSAGHDDALDAMLDQATKLYPTHFGVWFTRFYTAMLSGRPEASLALAADTANWPTGIDAEEIESVVRVAKAIQSRDPSAVEAVTKEWMEQAHHGAGRAENAAQFLSALGRLDEAFAVLRAYFFGEGFDAGEVRFARAQASFTPRNDRQTSFLFNPALKSARADPRFAKLTVDLGLNNYWHASGQKPDYLS